MGYDVGIVGAGIHGSAAAYHLSRRGLRTVVFEKGTPGSGPTGRSSAICRAYYTNPFLARMARDSFQMMERFVELTGQESGYVRTGMLFLHRDEDIPEVKEQVDRLNDLGIVTELLEPGELAARFPWLNLDGVALGSWERDAGHADAAGTTSGLFRKAVELGAEARLGTTVTAIETRAGGGAVVAAEDGSRTECERLLIAAGPWTRPLAAMAGADLPLTVERHIVALFRWGEAEPVPAHADLDGGYYMRPEGETLYLAGPLHPGHHADPDAFSESVSDAEHHDIARRVVRRAPHLERSEARGGWASLYDVSPDWQPVIGEIAPGIFVDAGTSGHGFKIAPALGGEVAALVAGEETDPGLAEFGPRRFQEGHLLAAGYGDARILG